MTLHSRPTLPDSPKVTLRSSRNLGDLKCFGMRTLTTQKEERNSSPSSKRHSQEP